jgi:Transposase DDE domain
VRFVAANRHPDHDTIATFRRTNFAAVAESFLQVLLLAKELKLLKLGVVSVDGSKFDANASKHRAVTYQRAGELVDQLRLEIAELLARAEAADGSGEEACQALPKAIARREALRAQLDAARRRLEAQAQAREKAERADDEAKVAARAQREGRAKGKHPKPPQATPGRDEQSNLSDPDSRLMRKSKHHEYRQAYNAQAVVDAEGSQLILGARISQCASDRNELGANVETIPAAVGRPATALADNGYANGAEVESLAEDGIEVLVATRAAGRRRRHDFRPAHAEPRPRRRRPHGCRRWRQSARARGAAPGTSCASRRSSRSSASSRRSSASPASPCAARARWRVNGTSWPSPTTASACTSSSDRSRHEGPAGPAIRLERPARPQRRCKIAATSIRHHPSHPARRTSLDPPTPDRENQSASKSKPQVRQSASC